MPLPTSANEWRQHFVEWARQTILFSFSVRGVDLGRPLDPTVDAKHVHAAVEEASRLAERELWSKALALTGGQFSDDTGIAYTRLVLDWCAKHLGYVRH